MHPLGGTTSEVMDHQGSQLDSGCLTQSNKTQGYDYFCYFYIGLSVYIVRMSFILRTCRKECVSFQWIDSTTTISYPLH